MSYGDFDSLPKEINYLIFNDCNLNTLYKISSCSKNFKSLVYDYLTYKITLWTNSLSPEQQKKIIESEHFTNIFKEVKNIQNIALDTLGNKLIHYASLKWHSDLHAIILLGGDLQAKDNQGNTPLHKGALTGNLQAIATLLSFKANKKAANQFGNTPSDIVKLSKDSDSSDILTKMLE